METLRDLLLREGVGYTRKAPNNTENNMESSSKTLYDNTKVRVEQKETLRDLLLREGTGYTRKTNNNKIENIVKK